MRHDARDGSGGPPPGAAQQPPDRDLKARRRALRPRSACRSVASPSAQRLVDQQRAARAVARRVDDDERAADAVVAVRGQRQRLLQLDDDAADIVLIAKAP